MKNPRGDAVKDFISPHETRSREPLYLFIKLSGSYRIFIRAAEVKAEILRLVFKRAPSRIGGLRRRLSLERVEYLLFRLSAKTINERERLETLPLRLILEEEFGSTKHSSAGIPFIEGGAVYAVSLEESFDQVRCFVSCHKDASDD